MNRSSFQWCHRLVRRVAPTSVVLLSFFFFASLPANTAAQLADDRPFSVQRAPQDKGVIGEHKKMSPREREAFMSSEVKEIRIAAQFGLGYLPLMVMRQLGLIEKYAAEANLGHVRVRWTRYPSGKAMNSALRTGLLDVASGGVPPMLRAWDVTRTSAGVKGIAALSSMPQFLNSRKAGITNVRGFDSADRIALPAVKVSSQAVLLQMAAAREFGMDNAFRLDSQTIAKNHPSGVEALATGAGGVSAHFTSPPYQYIEIDSGTAHRVLSSYDLVGVGATFTVMWTRGEFFESNPKTYQALLAALNDAIEYIDKNPMGAAEIFELQSNSGIPADYVAKLIGYPDIFYSTSPNGVMNYAKFMRESGTIKAAPGSWKNLFFSPRQLGLGN